jgi:phytoene dehydrogenase-like protein
MGSIAEALLRSARSRGVEVLLDAPVARIGSRAGRATGVELADGRRFSSTVVVSTADPKRTFLELIEPDAVPSEFAEAVRRIKIQGTAMKVNCALAELPDWRAAPGVPGPPHQGSTYLCPSIEYAEAAAADARQGRPSRDPWVELVTQSVRDPTVAPPGRHTASIYAQFSPYRLKSGTWDDLRDAYADRIVETVAEYAPNLPRAILARQVLTPLDLERRFGLTEGHQSHGDMGPDQFFSFRPVPGWADYRTPVAGLYFCGAGAHPGGGVTGAPGYNGARAVLEDWSALRASAV